MDQIVLSNWKSEVPCEIAGACFFMLNNHLLFPIQCTYDDASLCKSTCKTSGDEKTQKRLTIRFLGSEKYDSLKGKGPNFVELFKTHVFFQFSCPQFAYEKKLCFLELFNANNFFLYLH